MKSLKVRSLGGLAVLVCAGAAAFAPMTGCGGGSGGGLGSCPPSSDADQAAGAAIVLAECQTCHDSSLTGAARNAAPVGVDYDVQSVVLSTAQEMYDRMRDTDFPMPPDGNLSSADIELVRIWLACGAK